jgi:hypothetical protein
MVVTLVARNENESVMECAFCKSLESSVGFVLILLAGVWLFVVKIFSCSFYFVKNVCSCTFNAVCNSNTAINRINVQRKTATFPLTLTGYTQLVSGIFVNNMA